ncbi:MAG: hypothetical protein A2287_10745 [Candidatus Melainabacteria bacterium RIFOXYA12_FULL_32_12]|nr:MAG: hypothetical protein A2255_01745 [Candidatus Melainabacteria bacterium RIFOXYA2_FULL_32_9]OGI24281.1 MAG: hypothetical protein A2287_10745 [Candidatus Melainabacteria bacterium RIFOXYA12_FULL_32_12]
MKPFISICLPNYNYEKFLREAIESVLEQTFTNFELIIGDNASTDSSVEIIKSYNDPRIKFYQNESNISLYANINKCKDQAQGELIGVLHSDDKYHPDFLQEVVEAYIENPNHKVFITGVNFWHHEKDELIPWHPYKTAGIISKYEALMRLTAENNIGNGINVILHKDCFKKVEMYPNRYKYAADYDLWMRLAEKFEFVYIPKVLAYYRIHDSNLSHKVNKNLDMFKEGLEITEKNIIQSNVIPRKIKNELNHISFKNATKQAFYIGIKYKSGTTSRNMLNYVKHTNPDIRFEPSWHLTYLLSYLIHEKLSKNCLNYVDLLGKAALYPHKLYIKNYIDKLIREVTPAIE